MPFPEFWEWLQAFPLSESIGFTAWFPFLESIHVLAIGLVVGSILMVDLRLLGVAGLSYAASRMIRELIPWTWGRLWCRGGDRLGDVPDPGERLHRESGVSDEVGAAPAGVRQHGAVSFSNVSGRWRLGCRREDAGRRQTRRSSIPVAVGRSRPSRTLGRTHHLTTSRLLTTPRSKLGHRQRHADADAEFDIVATHRATHHIPHWETAVEEMLRVLKPGGSLSTATCCCRTRWHSLDARCRSLEGSRRRGRSVL